MTGSAIPDRMIETMGEKLQVFLKSEKLKDSIKIGIPDATVKEEVTISGEVRWLDVTKGKKHAVVQIEHRGYGISDLDHVVGFEGPEHVFEYPEEAYHKVREILSNPL